MKHSTKCRWRYNCLSPSLCTAVQRPTVLTLPSPCSPSPSGRGTKNGTIPLRPEGEGAGDEGQPLKVSARELHSREENKIGFPRISYNHVHETFFLRCAGLLR